MEIIKIKKDLDCKKLEHLSYTYSISEGGYISKDEATIIYISRSPYKRQIMQYQPNVELEHMKNIDQLRKIDILEQMV
jgi:hypothetical protein